MAWTTIDVVPYDLVLCRSGTRRGIGRLGAHPDDVPVQDARGRGGAGDSTRAPSTTAASADSRFFFIFSHLHMKLILSVIRS
jgi:hypothetical protein